MAEKKRIRLRSHYTYSLTMLVLLLMFIVDPDNGFIQNLPFAAGAVATFVSSLRPIVVITMIHITRKFLFDYVDICDVYTVIREKQDAVGLAIFVVGIGLFVLGFSIVFAVGMI